MTSLVNVAEQQQPPGRASRPGGHSGNSAQATARGSIQPWAKAGIIAFLAVLAAIEKKARPAPMLPEDSDQAPPAGCGIIALTVPEAQRLFHLFATLATDLPPRIVHARLTLHLRWSHWRRRHQARARWHHYRTRLALIA